MFGEPHEGRNAKFYVSILYVPPRPRWSWFVCSWLKYPNSPTGPAFSSPKYQNKKTETWCPTHIANTHQPRSREQYPTSTTQGNIRLHSTTHPLDFATLAEIRKRRMQTPNVQCSLVDYFTCNITDLPYLSTAASMNSATKASYSSPVSCRRSAGNTRPATRPDREGSRAKGSNVHVLLKAKQGPL